MVEEEQEQRCGAILSGRRGRSNRPGKRRGHESMMGRLFVPITGQHWWHARTELHVEAMDEMMIRL